MQTLKCLFDKDIKDSEVGMIELDVIHDNENDRAYAADEEIEEDTNKSYKDPSRKKSYRT